MPVINARPDTDLFKVVRPAVEGLADKYLNHEYLPFLPDCACSSYAHSEGCSVFRCFPPMLRNRSSSWQSCCEDHPKSTRCYRPRSINSMWYNMHAGLYCGYGPGRLSNQSRMLR